MLFQAKLRNELERAWQWTTRTDDKKRLYCVQNLMRDMDFEHFEFFEKARLMTAPGAPAIGPGTPVLPAICPRDNLFFNEWGFHHRRPQVQAFERTTRSTAIGLPVFSSGPSTQLVWSQCSTNRNTIFVTKTGLPILLGW